VNKEPAASDHFSNWDMTSSVVLIGVANVLSVATSPDKDDDGVAIDSATSDWAETANASNEKLSTSQT